MTPSLILQLVEQLRRHKGQALRPRELAELLAGGRAERDAVRVALEQLVATGAVRSHRGGRYGWAGGMVRSATVRVRHDGRAQAWEDDGDRPLGVIGDRHLGGALHGDRVLCLVVRKGPVRSEVRVLAVLERSRQRLVGQLARTGDVDWLFPQDRRYPPIRLVTLQVPVGQAGDLAGVQLDGSQDEDGRPTGTLVEVFGPDEAYRAEIGSLAFKYELPTDFPPEVVAAAAALPTEGAAASVPREDLRALALVTIDGETAKDFDDAVAVQPEGDGWRLWVAIADVSAFVLPGSPLDVEARRRGTSVYFPGTCLPMLPERLSNDLCSLRPQEDRLVLVAELRLDGAGQQREGRFYPAVMHSHQRFTYTRVQQLLDGAGPAASAEEGALLPGLQGLAALARARQQLRHDRGSLDFDLPEPEIVLDLQGQPENIIRAERLFAHRMIEEAMLAANEAVAAFLAQRDIPFLSRIHDPPPGDKLEDFQQLAASFNQGLRLGVGPELGRDLVRFLDRLQGRPEEALLHRALLRTMAQAVYGPERRGHFGLAASDYCHFTSPIRRYPDLLVHRALKRALGLGGGPLPADLAEEGQQASLCERRALEAERELVKLKQCQYMQRHLGENFTGRIAAVTSFGFFVALDEVHVEGLVPISSLGDDYYHFEAERHALVGERRRRQFQLGDKIAIIVEEIDLLRREIRFVLPGQGAPAAPVRPERQRRRPQGGTRRKKRR